MKNVWSVLAGKKYSHQMLECVGRLQYNISRQKAWTGIFRKPLLRRSMFCHILWKIIISGYNKEEKNLQKSILEETQKQGGFKNIHPRGYKEEQIIDLFFQKYEYYLKTAAIIGREAGIPCLFVLQPNQYLKDAKPYNREEREKYLNNRISKRQVSRFYPRLIKMYARLAQAGIFTYDATLVFKDTARTVYNDATCHFNPTGLEIICEAILKDLLNKKELFAIIPVAAERQGRLLELEGQLEIGGSGKDKN
jgi:hypothetical protein